MYHRRVEACPLRFGAYRRSCWSHAERRSPRSPRWSQTRSPAPVTAVGELLDPRPPPDRLRHQRDPTSRPPAAVGRISGGAEAGGVRFDPTLIVAAPPNAEGGYRAAQHLLELPAPPTGLFCFRDLMAMGAYQAATEASLRIPQDLSDRGFRQHASVVTGLLPGLTTVQLPHYEMGVWAARQLLALTESTTETGQTCAVSQPLVRRGSVTSPPDPMTGPTPINVTAIAPRSPFARLGAGTSRSGGTNDEIKDQRPRASPV